MLSPRRECSVRADVITRTQVRWLRGAAEENVRKTFLFSFCSLAYKVTRGRHTVKFLVECEAMALGVIWWCVKICPESMEPLPHCFQ